MSGAWRWLWSRLRPRRPATPSEWAAAGAAVLFTALIVFEALKALVSLLLGHWFLTAAAILLPVGITAGWLRRRAVIRRRRAERLAHLRLDLVADIDRLDPTAFEYAVRDLMIRDGIEAERVGGAGDRAADVIGRTATGRVIVVQCKHTLIRAKVGAGVIYQVNGTAEHAHRADDAVVITNGSFTGSAATYAAQVGIHLIDRDRLQSWAQDGVALQELLKLNLDITPWHRHRGRLRRHRRRASTAERSVPGEETFGTDQPHYGWPSNRTRRIS